MNCIRLMDDTGVHRVAMQGRSATGRHDPSQLSCHRTTTDTSEWDEFIASASHAYHEQTSMYGRIREGFGFTCDRVVVRDDQRISGGAQVLVQNTPIGRFARVFRAPLALDDDPQMLGKVVDELELLAHRHSYASVRVDTLPTQTAAREALERAGYRASRAWAPPHRSLVIRLTYSDDELLSRMRRKTRYDVRFAQRAGVRIHTGDAASIDEFFQLYSMSASFQEYVPFAKEYFDYLLRLFGKHGKVILCIAFHDQEPLAAILSTVSGNRMYAGWIGTNRGNSERKFRAQTLLHFKAMCLGRDHGCDLLDLQDNRKYKRKFTDEEIEWPAPMRRFYGPLRGPRHRLMQWSSSNPYLHRMVRHASTRLGLHPRMPY